MSKTNQMTVIANKAIASAWDMVTQGVQALDNPDTNPSDIIICFFEGEKPKDLGRHCARVRLKEAADKIRQIGGTSKVLTRKSLRELDRITEVWKELNLGD